MVKKRVHELARELNIESKVLIKKAAEVGISLKSHMSTLESEQLELVTNKIKGELDNNEIKKKSEKQSRPEKQQNTNDRRSEQKRGSKKDNRSNRRGPGIVDKVPSRPPDRRFSDKPYSQKFGSQQQTQNRRQDSERTATRYNNRNTTTGGQTRKTDIRQNSRPGGRPSTRLDNRQNARPAERFQGSKDRPRGKGKPIDKIMAAEKAKPELTKAQEKAKALERAKQAEKQAYRDKNKSNFSWKDIGEGKMPLRPGRKKGKSKAQKQEKPVPAEKTTITIRKKITVQEFADKINVSPADIIKKLMFLGVMATINQDIDFDVASIIAEEYNIELVLDVDEDEVFLLQEDEDDEKELISRPCVVTVMGHVDHGKTSLLDAIRQTKVVEGEAGGITQHIGAYQVECKGQKITFVDTPGHAAFTAMRARGAQVTDVAILVVAADDGVMPQTVEAINHAKAANVPIVVAINKMDKPTADPERVKRDLTEYGLVPEEWGGDTICVPVSATERQGLDELLEMILLVAEILELKANPNRDAKGTVIEAELDKGRGPVATVLVQNGTLKVGDAIVAGTAYGRVRAMLDDTGKRVSKAGPSFPVQVLGFSEVPEAGELFISIEDEKKARQIGDMRHDRKKEEEFRSSATKVSLEDIFSQIKEGQVKQLSIIIKGDVHGSVEALKQSIEKLSTDEVKIRIIHGGVGAITETDVMLASASNAIIIGFNIRPDINARNLAEIEKVDIRLYRVIYEAIDDVKAAMSGLLDPEYREVLLGRAEVRKTFKVSKIGTIAGCYVTEGKIVRDSKARIVRDGVVVYEGKLDSLRRFKDDAREVLENFECGLTLERYNDIQEGDIIEAYTTEEIKRELA